MPASPHLHWTPPPRRWETALPSLAVGSGQAPRRACQLAVPALTFKPVLAQSAPGCRAAAPSARRGSTLSGGCQQESPALEWKAGGEGGVCFSSTSCSCPRPCFFTPVRAVPSREQQVVPMGNGSSPVRLPSVAVPGPRSRVRAHPFSKDTFPLHDFSQGMDLSVASSKGSQIYSLSS